MKLPTFQLKYNIQYNDIVTVLKHIDSTHSKHSRDSLKLPWHLICLPLDSECTYHMNIVKYMVKEDKNSLTTLDIGGHLPLHHACLGGKLDVMNYILEESPVGVTFQNSEGKLPIELLLLYNTKCDRGSMEFVDTVESLLKANPAIALANLCPELFACGE